MLGAPHICNCASIYGTPRLMAPHGPFMAISTTSVPMIDFPMQFNSHATQYWTYTIAPLNGDGRAGKADGQTTTHARTLSVQLQLHAQTNVSACHCI